MEFDIIFVTGERFFDHPLCGTAILKRLLEKAGYSVGVIEMPQKASDVARLGKPRLFFGVASGSIDSMIRNYTPLKKKRSEDKHLDYREKVPDRAVIVYCNWVKQNFRESIIVIGGTEATLRRFSHYDYWDNRVRKSILLDSRADILVYGSAEKQTIEIAKRIEGAKRLEEVRKEGRDEGRKEQREEGREERRKEGREEERTLNGIDGTCVLARQKPQDFVELPSHEEVLASKDKFCDMQNLLSNRKNLCQKVGPSYVLQYKMPRYTSKDLDEYYGFPFARKTPTKELRGFEFSVVTHRGCIGNCNFCSLRLTQGDRIISRSEESILREIENMTKLPYFKGNIDDIGGPSADMYGMDCGMEFDDCERECISCARLDRSNKRLIDLLRRARKINGIRNVYLRSGIRFDLASLPYVKEICEHHVYDTLKIAPEHFNKELLRLMNKDKGELQKFIKDFNTYAKGKKLSFYFMTGHPGSSMKEAKELAEKICYFQNAETVQVFTPTPMTVSTCMYYTGMDPKTKKKIYVAYTYTEKKEQKRVVMNALKTRK